MIISMEYDNNWLTVVNGIGTQYDIHPYLTTLASNHFSTQIRFLLNREHLCSNTYLFKYLKNNLVLPLYAFAEERKIANITNN